MINQTATLALAAAALALSACNEPAPAPAARTADVAPLVNVADAWCRPTPNGAKAGACYLTLIAEADDRLMGGSTPRASELQVHEMTTENGMMRMRQLAAGLELPRGQAVLLAPGGAHLMLVGLNGPLVEGETASLTLKFASAPEATVQAPVRRQAASGMDHAGH